MSSVISFKNPKLQDKAVEIKRIGATPGILKYVLSKNMPSVEEKSVMIFTTDTAELFIGGGTGNPVKKVSDVIVVPNIDALPEIGLKEKLYVSAAESLLYFWTQEGYQQIGVGDGSGGIIQTKIFEYSKAAQFPPTGQIKAIYIAKDADFMYRYDEEAGRYVQLARQSTDPTIAAKFDAINIALIGKAEKTSLSDYRAKTDRVAESDLDPATQAKLNQNLTRYDDSAIKTRVTGVELNKADKTQLSNYRQKAEKIAQSDLDLALSGKIDSIPAPYNDAQIKSDITALQNNKTDKSALIAFRKSSDKIVETDLSEAVIAKLDKPAYDDSVVLAELTKLNEAKIDTVDAENTYRKKSNSIREIDLESALVSKINTAAAGYDDTDLKTRMNGAEQNKTDKSYAESTYVKKTDKISETQFDSALATKLSNMQNMIANKADQSTVAAVQNNVGTLTSNVNNLQTAVNSKADASTVANLQNNVNTLQTDINSVTNHLSTIDVHLENLETKIDKKVDNSALVNYRPVTDKVTADDLAPSVKQEVVKVSVLEQTLADLLKRIAALENVATSKDILSLATVTPMTVAYGCSFASLLLPNKMTASLSDSTTASLRVTWNSATYNANIAGIYTIDGVLTLPSDVTNTKGFKPSVQVTVQPQASGDSYSYEFSLTGVDWDITLDQIHSGLQLTDEEFYGPSLDTGEGATVKVYYIGTEPTRQYSADPQYVPTDLQKLSNDTLTSPTPDQFASFDGSINTISFGNASLGTRVYKLVKTA
jgi:hypothetical protein